jgi:serine/threonine protein kinase
MGGSTLPLAPDAYSGRKLGKYEVLCRLSTGGMAEIFLASQRGLAGFRKLVVLKQILPDIAGEEEFVQMFLDEARVTAAFNHPHIAQVFDLDVADGELFLAMEFVPGATLVEVAKACRAASEPIPIGFSLEAVRDTALALHYAHLFTDPLGRPSTVIHRDVAEKNIMVTYEGVTKLLDFGIAKNLARKSRTQIGMVKGTSGYMSPEQILGEELDPRSDLFSLGVVLHECLTGLRLFHAKTPEAGAGAVLHGQVPPPSRANRAVPPELDAIVLKALSRKREDRYTTTLEFARALERAVGPLIWHPEQSAELIQRLFADRRDQTRQLLVAERALSGESTGQVNVAQLFAPPAPPPLPPEPGTVPSLPQITPALPAPHRPSMAAMPVVKPLTPSLPEPVQAKPPTPPRGAPTRRSSAGTAALTSPEASVRRPVFDPLPQKRGSASSPSEPVPPPPPQENTARTQPEEPTLQGTPDEDGPHAGERTEHQELPHFEDRTRPIRMDLHTMGTIPEMDGPLGLRSPPVEPEPADEESTRQIRTTLSRVRFPPSDTLPTRPSNPGVRLQQRRAPTPPPPEPEEQEPPEDTNETLIPEGEGEEAATIITSPTMLPRQKQQRGGLLVVLAAAVLLVGGAGTAVALGLDGGRLMALVSPPPLPVEDLGRLEPIPKPTPPAGASAPEPAPAPATAAPTEPAPSTPPAPDASAEPPAPDMAEPSATPSGATAEGVVPLPEAPEAPPPGSESTGKGPEAAVGALETLKEALPSSPPAKKNRPPKRPRRDSSRAANTGD